jgi:hypothetical protein
VPNYAELHTFKSIHLININYPAVIIFITSKYAVPSRSNKTCDQVKSMHAL